MLLTKEPNMKDVIEREIGDSEATVHRVDVDTLGMQVVGPEGTIELC